MVRVVAGSLDSMSSISFWQRVSLWSCTSILTYGAGLYVHLCQKDKGIDACVKHRPSVIPNEGVFTGPPD